MSKKSPTNGPKSSRGTQSPASGRSSSARGSYKRKRGGTMSTLVSILKAVDALGAKGKEFGTSDLRDHAKISAGQAYMWLQVFRAHDFVSGRLVTTGRPSGDWRWKRKFRIVRTK